MIHPYEAVIGLECHAQLLTKSKLFCSCSTKFGDAPNANTCPVCLGLPGALPVFNRVALMMAVKASHGLNCKINTESQWARKNYFYPDLPKGYQISQYDRPLAQYGLLRSGSTASRKKWASSASIWKRTRGNRCMKDFRIQTARPTSISTEAESR